jgi:hypothetical protein
MTDQTHDLADLAGRLYQLERRCRLWRLVGIGSFVLSAFLVFGGAAAKAPKVVQAERIEIVNEKGDPVIELGLEEGDPTISILDPESGGVRLITGLLKNQPYLEQSDGKSKRKLTLAVYPGAGPRLNVFDAAGKKTASFP